LLSTAVVSVRSLRSWATPCSQADHALMNLCGDGRSQPSKATAEDREIGGRVGIEVGEAALHQVAAQLSFQIAAAPAFQGFHDTAAQHTIGGHAGTPRAGGTGATFRQALEDQVDQSGIIQELIDRVEQIVLEQGGLRGQGRVEEPGLVRRRRDYIRTRLYRVSKYLSSNKKWELVFLIQNQTSDIPFVRLNPSAALRSRARDFCELTNGSEFSDRHCELHWLLHGTGASI
jgi:hypothetical protein